jgi:diguanylate cyclase (GGDEF)-like protein
MTRMERSDNPSGDILSLAQIQHLMRVEFSRAQRYKYPIVCLVLGLDQLGHIRDQLGYELKEEVLDAFMDLMHLQTRGSDFLGRLPDDRFMVVVPHSKPDQVEIMAERIVSGTRDLRLESLADQALTLTIGGSWLLDGETMFFDDLMTTAQNCLAEASQAGGDRVLMRAPQGLL